MRTGTQASTHRNNSTAIQPGERELFVMSSVACRALFYLRRASQVCAISLINRESPHFTARSSFATTQYRGT